jgi:hypothetical protein
MAYKTSELEKQALKAINEHNLFFIEDVVSYLPCSKPTFYEHKLNESDSIKKALDQNKIITKVNLRKYWGNNHNPTTDIALYKLIGTDGEIEKLTSQKSTIEHKGTIKIDFTND